MHRNLENILIEGRISEGVQPQTLVLKLIQEFLAKKKFKIGKYSTSKQIEKKIINLSQKLFITKNLIKKL